MAGAAAEAHRPGLVNFVQDTAAGRTAEWRGHADRLVAMQRAQSLDFGFVLEQRRHLVATLHPSAREPSQERPDLRQLGDVIGLDVVERAARHVGAEGVLRILNHGGAAALLDRQQTAGAVVERTGEDGADGPRAVVVGGGAEKWVDGRTVAVLFGAADEPQPPRLDQHVVVGRGDVDAARRKRFLVLRMQRRKRAGAGEDMRECAAVIGREVENDHHGGRQIFRKRRRDFLQRLDAAGRGANADQIPSFHCRSNENIARTARQCPPA